MSRGTVRNLAAVLVLAIVLGFLLLLALPGAADDKSITGVAALARMKTLEGNWEGVEEDTGATVLLEYRTNASGNTVEETFVRGRNLEMVTLYYLCGSNLQLTHYCAAGNRPDMRVDRAVSGADRLVFRFAGGAVRPNRDPHMHNGMITFLGPDEIETRWTAWRKGAPAGETVTVFRRVQP